MMQRPTAALEHLRESRTARTTIGNLTIDDVLAWVDHLESELGHQIREVRADEVTGDMEWTLGCGSWNRDESPMDGGFEAHVVVFARKRKTPDVQKQLSLALSHLLGPYQDFNWPEIASALMNRFKVESKDGEA